MLKSLPKTEILAGRSLWNPVEAKAPFYIRTQLHWLPGLQASRQRVQHAWLCDPFSSAMASPLRDSPLLQGTQQWHLAALALPHPRTPASLRHLTLISFLAE